MAFVITTLSACGGGSKDSVEWEEGVYPEASSLENYCESPRTSTASASYLDQDGSNFLEKMWLRSWSNDIYLWYRELSDVDVNLYDTPQDYFDSRKTFATTASGAAQDQFHFYYDTEEYEQQTSSGASVSYGMTLKLISTSVPREAVVIYVEPGSPADIAGITRGASILTVDGADLVSTTDSSDIDILNNGLFPSTANESHTFEIADSGSDTSRTVTLVSDSVVESPVLNTQTYIDEDTDETIGYLTFNTFGTYTAEESLVESFEYLAGQNVSDLVLDLRYNGGGYVAISSQLAYMIAGPDNTEDKTYYKTVFNDKYSDIDPYTGTAIQAYPFIDTGVGLTVSTDTSLPTLNLDRVYVLTTDSTCSASEALINGLQGIGVEVIQIGGKTCGKPYGFRGIDNCGTTYFTIMFKGENNVGFGDYADGFYPVNSSSTGSVSVPGCEVEDDYNNLLGDLDEPMLKAALDYRDTGECPTITSFRTASKSLSNNLTPSGADDLLNNDRLRSKLLLKNILLIK